MENLSWVFQKQKKKRKKQMKRLIFITQFKIEFLLPFTGCRKVLGKMPAHLFSITVLLEHPFTGQEIRRTLVSCACRAPKVASRRTKQRVPKIFIFSYLSSL